MYVLVIGRAYPDEKTGMMGIFEFEQAVALRKHGLKTVYLFCDTRSVKSLRKVNYLHKEINDVPVYGYHLPIGGAPRYLFDKLKTNRTKSLIKRILNDHGVPDIIHVHYPLLNLNDEIWDLLKSLNRPIVATEHWTKIQTKKIESFRCDLLKRVVNEVDHFICVGDPLKNSIIELTGSKKRIEVIPNMLKSIFFYEEQLQDKKTFKFITVGRLVEVKRFGLAIDAFTKAFRKNPNVQLHIVGDGPLYNSLNQQINDLEMNDRITMHGFLSREKTANYLRKSDAFVSASVLETFGVPFIEAMACGKPVIGIENGPIDKYINNKNGVLVQRDNIDDLTNAFISVYKNRKSFNGKLISDTANRLFSEQAVTKQLNKIYLDSIKMY